MNSYEDSRYQEKCAWFVPVEKLMLKSFMEAYNEYAHTYQMKCMTCPSGRPVKEDCNTYMRPTKKTLDTLILKTTENKDGR